jgi:plastocyanin
MRKMMIALFAVAVLAVGAATAQAGTAPATARHAALLVRVNVAASEFKYVLNKKSAGRGVVIFKVTNVGAVEHNFQISGRKTKMLKHGQSATLRVTFLRKGAYAYKCTVPGHAAAGMKGVFTIK